MTPWSKTELRLTAAMMPAGMPMTEREQHGAQRQLDRGREQRGELVDDRLVRDDRRAEIAAQRRARLEPVLDDAQRLVEAVLVPQFRVPRRIDAVLAGQRLDRIAGDEADQKNASSVTPMKVGTIRLTRCEAANLSMP